MAKLPFKENIRIAFDAINTQKLRAILTMLIIAIGIMAMVGMLTATTSFENVITGQFARLGANTFTIQSRGMRIQIGRSGNQPKQHPSISWREATDFRDRFKFQGAIASLSYTATSIAEVKFGNKATDPNVTVWAGDENYLATSGYTIAEGRSFSEQDVLNSRPVVILGKDVYDQLFDGKSAVDTLVSVRGQRYRVIGVLEEKGSSSIFSGDRAVFIPISRARSSIGSPSTYSINVMASAGDLLDATVGEATATMRAIRKLEPIEDDNFTITRSDALSSALLENKAVVYTAAILISLITLSVAAINLMNIMLVSVTQRKKEIGTRMAIGANKRNIVVQFLMEAIVVSQLGGLFGVVLGLGIGNLIGMLMDSPFTVPWNWIFFALILTLLTGIISGLYPAIKASRLNPIDALRFE